MRAPTIYFVRHGETEWNAAGRFQGWRDIPLNARGRVQAARAGVILGDLMARGAHDPARLGYVASPLGRARETMELMRAALGVPPASYRADERLREIGYGEWEGLTVAEMEAAHPAVFAARKADKWQVAAPGGETYAAIALRLKDWIASLTQDTVAVAHSGTARALMVALGVAPAASAGDLPVAQGAVYVFADGGMAQYS
jgi:probable phosphoglycerate mutase